MPFLLIALANSIHCGLGVVPRGPPMMLLLLLGVKRMDTAAPRARSIDSKFRIILGVSLSTALGEEAVCVCVFPNVRHTEYRVCSSSNIIILSVCVCVYFRFNFITILQLTH